MPIVRNILGFLFLFQLLSCSSQDAPISPENTSTSTRIDYILKDYQKKWAANKQYTIEVLEAMPEADFEFQPAEEMRTFKEQAEHIAVWLNNHLQQAGHPGLPELDTSSKEKLIESYLLLFDELIAYMEELDPETMGTTKRMWYGESTRLRLLNLMDNHLAHHRGQMIVYLRLKGIKPPSYVGW